MGNIKYPINGRELRLEDLIYEYGLNTAQPSNYKDDSNMYNDISFLREHPQNIFNVEYDIIDAPYDDTSSYINYNIYKSYYESFKNDIMDTINEGRARNSYEICYFPDVYSTTARTADNTTFECIQKGDYEQFSPDRYITFAEVKPEFGMRIPILFHYIYNDINSNNARYDERFSFNYKRSDGMATASYAIQELYKLQSDLSELFDNKTIDNILFGDKTVFPNSSDNTNIQYITIATPSGSSSGCSLLYNLINYKDKIINSNNAPTQNAYKYLHNSEYRDKNPIKYIIDTNNKISINNNDGGYKLFNVMLEEYLFGNDNNNITSKYTYRTYDSELNDNKIENLDDKKYNLYYKILYYCYMIIGCQTYKTGLILDAKFDVLYETHTYKKSNDPLFRCDVGPNITITSIEYDTNRDITINYALPARSLIDSDTISISIPVIIKSVMNESYTSLSKNWDMTEIKKLLKVGINVNADENIEDKYKFEYMELYRYTEDAKYVKYTDDIDILCNSSLGIYPDDINYNIEVKSEESISYDSSLNIYNPKTNYGWNTISYVINNSAVDQQTLFVGYLHACIKYTDQRFYECNIPIYRLSNYYYIQTSDANRENFIYFINFTNLDISIVNNIPYIKYGDEDEYIIYYGSSDDVYLCSKTGSQKIYKYITGVSQAHDVARTKYTSNPIIINNTEVLVQDTTIKIRPQYKIAPEYVESGGVDIQFNTNDTTALTFKPLSSLPGNKSITIHNYINDESISVLINSIGVSNKYSIYTGFINSGENINNIKWNNNCIIYMYSRKTDKIIPILNNTNNYVIILHSTSLGIIEESETNFITCTTNTPIFNNMYIYDKKIYKLVIQIFNESGQQIIENESILQKVRFKQDIKISNDSLNDKLNNSLNNSLNNIRYADNISIQDINTIVTFKDITFDNIIKSESNTFEYYLNFINR